MKVKIEGDIFYDKKKTAARLRDLRLEYEAKNGYRNLSALQLTKLIEEKTGIKFGGNTYNKHESYDNTSTMSIEMLTGLSKFYEVSYDYILGFSNSKQPEREDIQSEYGLTDEALNRLKSITLLNKQQENTDPNLPTDLDIVNALFESGEFQDWISLIKSSVIQRARSGQIDSLDSIKKRSELVASLSKDQYNLCKDGALTMLAADDTKQFIQFQLQRTTLNIVQDIMDSL